MQTTHKKGWLGALVKLVIVVVVFTFIAKRLNFREMGAILRNAAVLPLVITLMLFVVNRVLTAVKWDLLLRQNGICAGLGNLVRIMFASGFVGIALPSGVGADVVRLIQLGKEERNLTGAAGSVLADRMLAVLALSLMSTVAAAFAWQLIEQKQLLVGVLTTALLLTGLILALMSKYSFRVYSAIHDTIFRTPRAAQMDDDNNANLPSRIRRKVEEIHGSFGVLLRKPGLFAAVLTMNLMVQIVRVVQIHLLFRALHTPVPVVYEVAFVPMIILITLLPFIPPLGLGVKEGAFAATFSTVGVAIEVAVSVSVLSHLVSIIGLLPGAVFLFAGKRRRADSKR